MHHFLTTGFWTFLGLVRDLEQTSLGMSTHSSAGLGSGTSLVTCLHSFWGSKLQVSSGTSDTTVSVFGKHSSGPGFSSQPDGPQSSRGTFLHSVSGEYFLTLDFSLVQTCLGHLVHFFSVVYPWVTSSHFSSWTVSQLTTSSSTSCSWYLVSH